MTATYRGNNDIPSNPLNVPFHPGIEALRAGRTPRRVCLLDASNGINLPQKLAELFEPHNLGVPGFLLNILADGPDNPDYWDAYQRVLLRAKLISPWGDSETYHLHEDDRGSLYAVENIGS